MTSESHTLGGHVPAAEGHAADAREPVRVIYIAGAARSGSTLLSSLLGALPGFLAVAEARLLWRNTAQRLCGCGQSVDRCPVWGPVLQRVLRDLGPPPEIEALQQRTIRDRHLPARLRSPRSRDARAYVQLQSIVYHTLAEQSGARTIVDSSKAVAEAALLRHVEGVEPIVIHLVRDPRAVAYSWKRAYRRREGEAPSSLSTARDWMLNNIATEALVRAYPSYARIRVRYEDLVARPQEMLTAVTACGGSIEDDGGEAVAGHMVGGNALRFGDDAPPLKPDIAWRTEMPRSDLRTVTSATLPLLRRYGYPINLSRVARTPRSSPGSV